MGLRVTNGPGMSCSFARKEYDKVVPAGVTVTGAELGVGAARAHCLAAVSCC